LEAGALLGAMVHSLFLFVVVEAITAC
jgi:hypothetical protein